MVARRIFVAALCVSLLTACATGAGLDRRPLDSGVSRDFEASFDRVSAAADQTMSGMSITVQGSRMEGASRVINFTKTISAFSWGEVGRVVITPVDGDTTRVFVDSEKRHQLQVTGTSEAQFAGQIFSGIEGRLAAR